VQDFLTGFTKVSRQTPSRVFAKLLPFVRDARVYREDSYQSVILLEILRARYIQ
jgi:hypothetical protein